MEKSPDQKLKISRRKLKRYTLQVICYTESSIPLSYNL